MQCVWWLEDHSLKISKGPSWNRGQCREGGRGFRPWPLSEELVATQDGGGPRAAGRCCLRAPGMLGGQRPNEQSVFQNNQMAGRWKVLVEAAVGTDSPGMWVCGRKSEGWGRGPSWKEGGGLSREGNSSRW